jgi:hypothetical protein
MRSHATTAGLRLQSDRGVVIARLRAWGRVYTIENGGSALPSLTAQFP